MQLCSLPPSQPQLHQLMPLPYEWDASGMRLKLEIADGPFPIRMVAKLTSRKARRYIILLIDCPDRKKLLYDTLNTLTDLDYNIQHAEIRNIRDKQGNIREG